jgi:phosphoribosylglycinamide formyltransferase-1
MPTPLLRQSLNRTLPHPRYLAGLCGAEYVVCPHNTPECCDVLRRHEIDLGVIFGARILKAPTIQACRIGILNLHPGWLPDVRGLDTIKWPLLRGLPLGATAHLIDESIDRGLLVCRQQFDRLPGDTLFDLQARVWDLERTLMIDALAALARNPDTSHLEPLGAGEYFKQMPAEVERTLTL